MPNNFLGVSGKPRLLYILSPSYSGSTLLTMLLAQHSTITTIGEMKATARGDLENYFCSCGDSIRTCKFWKKIESDCAEKDINFTLEEFGTHFRAPGKWWDSILGAQVRGKAFEKSRTILIKLIPALSRRWHSILERNQYLMSEMCALEGGSIFLDGSKDPNRLLYFIQSGLWDIDVIKMVRDGRAQSHSTRRKTHIETSFEAACKDWEYTVTQMNRVCDYLPVEKVHPLTYEALCDNPNEVMNRLWNVLGLEPLPQDWCDVDLKATTNHILGNNMRTKSRIQIKRDTAWEKELSESEQQVFERIAGRCNQALGYR